MAVMLIADVPDNAASSGTDLRIAVDGKGTLHLAYIALNPSNNLVLRHAVGTPQLALMQSGGFFTDVSYQWSHVDVLALPPGLFQLRFDLALDSQGTPHLCFESSREDDHTFVPELLHLVLDGSPAEHVYDFSSLGSFGLAMTIAKDDSIHIALSDELGVHHATRTRNASAFQTETVDNRRNTFFDLSIAIGSAGPTGISYIRKYTDLNGGALFQLLYAERTNGGWVSDVADPGPIASGIPPSPFSARGTNSLVVDTHGVPHIAYCIHGLGIRHATRTAGAGSWVAAGPLAFGEAVDAAGQPGPATILLDASDSLHIAYQANVPAGTTELRFATRTTLGGWTTTTLDPSINCGWSISAAFDPSARLHVGYGVSPSTLVAPVSKHLFAVDLSRIPFPRPRPHKPVVILRRPE